jgi:hypothetical protein
MSTINDYARKIEAITSSGKFPKHSIEQKLLGLYNGISSFSNTIERDNKDEINKRFGAIFVNLLDIANSLELNSDDVLAKRIEEIEECHGTCKRK